MHARAHAQHSSLIVLVRPSVRLRRAPHGRAPASTHARAPSLRGLLVHIHMPFRVQWLSLLAHRSRGRRQFVLLSPFGDNITHVVQRGINYRITPARGGTAGGKPIVSPSSGHLTTSSMLATTTTSIHMHPHAHRLLRSMALVAQKTAPRLASSHRPAGGSTYLALLSVIIRVVPKAREQRHVAADPRELGRLFVCLFDRSSRSRLPARPLVRCMQHDPREKRRRWMDAWMGAFHAGPT